MNHVMISGNLVRDPEMRYLDGGKAVTNFTLALNERGRDGKEYTSFIRCAAWGEQAIRVAEQAKTGTRLVVSGKLSQKTWQDKAGNKHDDVTVVVNTADVVIKQAPPTLVQADQQVGDIPF